MYLCVDKIRGSVSETDGKNLGAVLISLRYFSS